MKAIVVILETIQDKVFQDSRLRIMSLDNSKKLLFKA